MGVERGGSLDKESCRQRLLREWLELEEQYDRELAWKFYDTRGGSTRTTPPQPSALETELADLAEAVKRAKDAYEEARQPT